MATREPSTHRGVVAIIPARRGSKGIAGKNMRLVGGKPLVQWTIEQAQHANSIDRVVVSTDFPEVVNLCFDLHCMSINRPEHLATDDAKLEPVLLDTLHILEDIGLEHDICVLLQPTSPLRDSEDIDTAVNMVKKYGYDSLLSANLSHRFLWHGGKDPKPINYSTSERLNRQDRIPELAENGSIYAFKVDGFKANQCRLFGDIGIYVMEEEKQFEIDSEFDLEVCDWLLSKS